MTYIKVSADSGYFRVAYSTALPSGATVQITAPFTVRAGTNNYNNIETRFLASASAPATRGKDKSSAPMGLYSFDRLNWWNKDALNEVFTHNSWHTPTHMGYVDIFHSGYFSTPWFSKEVRFLEYLEKLEWNLPKGYKIEDPLPIQNDLGATKTISKDPGSTSSKIIHNIADIYDLAFVGPGNPSAGKWQLPDDYWRLTMRGRMKATRAAKIGNSTMTRVATWRKPGPGGTATTNARDVTLIYNGEGTLLDINPKIITAYGPTVKNPVLTMTNPNSYAMNDVYFYIDGNVKDVKLKDVSSNTTYNGQGINNCWVKVSSFASGDSKSFEMTYTYNGKATCDDDTVVVYTASGFDLSWTPNYSNPIDLTDELHVGYSDEFIIKTAPATVGGSITSSKDTVPHESAGDYQIKASFNTLSSGGALKNPEMIFTVPKGQYYVANSVRLEYPVGTLIAAPGIEAALAAIGAGTETTDRTITLKLADAKGNDILIPGNLDPTATPADLTASIVLTMKASCETEIFETLQYEGEISGTSACNATATGNGTKIVSPVLYPDVSYNYIFDDIATTTASGVRAFNEVQTQDTILLTVKKIVGTVNNMIPTDSLEILMPEELDLDGTSIYYEGVASMSAITGTTGTVGHNSVTSGVRKLQFQMPIAAYNAATNKGVGDNVTYKIPVKYTPNGQTRAANPVDSIISDIYSLVYFGTCPPVRASVGDGKDSVALMTADSIPYIVYVADTADLEITSNGFTGSWYPDKTSGTVLSTSNPWLFTPTDTLATGDTTFYFSSIVDGHDYGRLPYPVKIYIHPWFIQDLDTFNYVCEDEDSLFVRAGGMDVKYQWYYDLTTPITGATDTFYVASLPGWYHVLVTDSVGETISSDTMDVYFNVVPVFTKDLPDKVKECNKWGYNLNIETTGKHLLYQWYRDGVEIPGANSDSYYALSNDSSAFFRVTVKTLCGDSIVSNQCFVDFCDGKYPVDIKREVTIIAPATIDTDPGEGIHYVQSQDNFVFTVNVHDGFSLEYVNITTDDPIWTDQGGIIKEAISENEMKVTIRTVTKPLIVTVSGISPVDNEEIENGVSQAWAHNGKIYIKTTEAQTVYVFTTMGHLYMHEKVEEGTTSFKAEPGVYFIKFNNGYSGKVFVK